MNKRANNYNEAHLQPASKNRLRNANRNRKLNCKKEACLNEPFGSINHNGEITRSFPIDQETNIIKDELVATGFFPERNSTMVLTFTPWSILGLFQLFFLLLILRAVEYGKAKQKTTRGRQDESEFPNSWPSLLTWRR
ncbi:hypothetical protein CDAR_115841 [Caerostris darwini]|uniref:Uncharacterized protein n=1 Tax=Caerostris darwini TaxID=1538125 RepID=A0AAV4PME2_9ARAC|nr:hypothetical protein CDAR_115841 [Caerostris darwini]